MLDVLHMTSRDNPSVVQCANELGPFGFFLDLLLFDHRSKNRQNKCFIWTYRVWNNQSPYLVN